jgi:hypothetical protein
MSVFSCFFMLKEIRPVELNVFRIQCRYKDKYKDKPCETWLHLGLDFHCTTYLNSDHEIITLFSTTFPNTNTPNFIARIATKV